MAISSPLLEASIDGAHGVLLSIQGGSDLGLFEINEAAQLVANSAAPDANIIFGAVIDDALGDEVRVTVIAAGFDEAELGRARSGRSSSGFGGTAGGYQGSSWRIPGAGGSDVAPGPGTEAGEGSAAGAGGPSAANPAFPPSTSKIAAAEHPAAGPSAAGQPGAEPQAGKNAAASTPAGADGAGATAGAAADQGKPVVDGVPAPRGAESDAANPLAGAPAGSGNGTTASAHTGPGVGAAWLPDSSSTRRRSVVFEEDDDLDVPDFLK
jgi:cell division protein FtsZ